MCAGRAGTEYTSQEETRDLTVFSPNSGEGKTTVRWYSKYDKGQSSKQTICLTRCLWKDLTA